MTASEKQVAITPPSLVGDSIWENNPPSVGLWRSYAKHLWVNTEMRNVFTTFATTLAVFGIYLVQGVFVANILGPLGRGEFGTAMFFPRDVFLYAGLLGGIEIVNSYAVQGTWNLRSLKYSAAKVGLISGIITAVVAGLVASLVLASVGKTHVIPYCLVCCLFVPFEHMQLTISAVDRGSRNFRFYNVNRILYAASFLTLIGIVYGLNLNTWLGLSPLPTICGLFVISRIVGILPTLRGMDVPQTLMQILRPSVSNPSTPDDSSTLNPTNDQASVPGPWTLLKNGRFYAFSMLASELFERMDMFLIVAIASLQESGYYFVAVPAAQLLIVAPNALSVFTFNAGATRERKVTLKQAISVMAGTAALQLVSAIVMAFLIPVLIIMFFKEPYRPAIPFALWLLPACAIKGYLQAVDGYLKGCGKPMIGVWARFLSMFAMLGFVGSVYAGWIQGPEEKLLSIPMAACLGQAISMLIISTAVIQDTIRRDQMTTDSVEEDVDVLD